MDPDSVDPACNCKAKQARAASLAFKAQVFDDAKAWDAYEEPGWCPSVSSCSDSEDLMALEAESNLVLAFGKRQAKRL